jgi:hypothetical protein
VEDVVVRCRYKVARKGEVVESLDRPTRALAMTDDGAGVRKSRLYANARETWQHQEH